MSATSSSRIPSLDALRGLSIMLVLLGHLDGTQNVGSALAFAGRADTGSLGVRVFFVISGFLITSLLVAERERTGRISLAGFYFRRTLRIMPAYLTFVATVAALWYAGQLRLNDGDLLHALTYTMNYHIDRAWPLGHTWSLAVEEQFYLLWPLVMLVAPTRSLRAVVATVLVVPVIRTALFVLAPDYRPIIGNAFETVADALAVGCALALARPRLEASAAYRRARASWGPALSLAVLIAIPGIIFTGRPSFLLPIGQTLQIVAIAHLIDFAITYPQGRVGRVLNWAPLMKLGVWSYSIYLWQQLFIDRQSSSVLAAFPLNIVLALAAGAGSYYLVERPALRFRARLEAEWRARREAAAGAELEAVAATASPTSAP